MAKKLVIGIDLGGTNLKIALVDLKYRLKDKVVLSTKNFLKKESLICVIADSINKFLRVYRIKKSEVQGVGLGLPGPVDINKGIVHFFPNIPGWKEVNLKRILEARLGLPVFLDNDANLMSLAEFRLGAARGFKRAVCLTLGTGVGGGIILGGSLYRGANNAAGEIGHIPINEKGPRCNCGGKACLEAYIGNKRILKEAKRVFKRNISLEELSKLARQNNKQAIKIWAGAGERLGIALSGVVNLLNPEAIVIGGGVAGAGSALFARIKKTISRRAMSVQAKEVKVLRAKLGSNAGLIGAAILVREGARR